MAKDLRTFIEQVKNTYPREFVEVTNEVDLQHEATALVEKLEKEDRFPALLFSNVKGLPIPILVNLCSSYERLALALDTDVENMVERSANLMEESKPLKWIERGDAPVKEVVWTEDKIDLYKLPIPVHNELDAGQYISSGVALVKDPDSGEVNGGIYRHQVQGKDELGWFVNPSNHGNYLRLRYEELDKPMDVAIVIGHHPALLLAGVSKMTGIGGELEVMGGLMEESVEVVPGETVDLPIPANAEIVVEGKIYPGNVRDEGPFGEWPRYYTGTGDRPYIKVTAITMRKNPIYLDIAAAMPDHNMVGCLPRMGSLYKKIKEGVPSLVNVNLPLSGGGRVFCYISISKKADGEPKQAAFAALATDPSIREVTIVDDDIDVFNERQVLWARSTRFQADIDLAIIPYAMGSWLNPTAYDQTRLGKGPMETKMIFDATMPAPPTDFPKRTQADPKTVERLLLEKFIDM
ncbi:MAG: hypothetical protein BZY82_07060 [SAR202 cluster bacterium Io17-Chloro-G3]|nr:MAG: hypothetical protein BZY82_07060 [SAR202 cluster bacterium Io17-Chloro-G3]